MENATRTQQVAVVVEQPADETVSFDQWWMVLNAKTPLRAHLKEILLAEFKSRGLSKNETKERYDDALRLFGITP